MDKRLGNSKQLCGYYRFEVSEGKGKGMDMAFLYNGAIALLVNLSRASDIHQCFVRGRNVSFLSKNGLTVDPRDFLRSFPGGMLYTCGLDSLGSREGFYPHGNVHNIPATVESIEESESGVILHTRIEATALFGMNLVIHREISLKKDELSFTVKDRLVNEGHLPASYCMLYHCNFGYPLVDEGTRIEGEYVSSLPRTPFAEKEFDKRRVMEKPEDSMEETCYFDTLKDGKVSLVNDSLPLKATVESNLPYLVEWKSRASGDYVIGLEPTTSFLDDRFVYSTLDPQKEVIHQLKITFDERK